MNEKEIKLQKLYKRELNKTKQEKEIDENIKKQSLKAEQKQAESDLLLSYGNDFKAFLDKTFQEVVEEQNGKTENILNAISLYFYNIDTRKKIIKKFGCNSAGYNYLDKNYNRIINAKMKIWEKHLKYLETTNQIKQLEETQKQAKKEETKSIMLAFFRFIGLFIKWAFIVLFGWLYLIIKILSLLAKGA